MSSSRPQSNATFSSLDPRDDTLLHTDEGNDEDSQLDSTTLIIYQLLSVAFPPTALTKLRSKLALIGIVEIAMLLMSLLISLSNLTSRAPTVTPADEDPLPLPQPSIPSSPLLTYVSITSRHPMSLLTIVFYPYVSPNFIVAILTLPIFFVLSLLTTLRPNGIRTYVFILVAFQFVGGSIVWLFGRSAYYQCGAVGWCFCLSSYLLATSVVLRDSTVMTVTLIVSLVQALLTFSLTPMYSTLTYEPVLTGIVIGFLIATNDTLFSNDLTASIGNRVTLGLERGIKIAKSVLYRRDEGDASGLGEHSGLNGTSSVGIGSSRSYQQSNDGL